MADRNRPVVVVVGDDRRARTMIAGTLIDRGNVVLVCRGPWEEPGACSLLHDDRCILLGAADVAVVLPTATRPAGTAALSLCARAARRVVLGGEVSDPPANAVVLDTDEPHAVAGAVEAAAQAARSRDPR